MNTQAINNIKRKRIQRILKDFDGVDVRFNMMPNNQLKVSYKIPKKYLSCSPYIQSCIEEIVYDKACIRA